MLSWDAHNRPNFIKLRMIFDDPDQRLLQNWDNKDFVDSLIESTMKKDDQSLITALNQNKPESDDEEQYDSEDDLEFTQIKGEESKDTVNDLQDKYQSNKDSTTKIKRKTLSGGTGDQITMRIRELQNGVTKLISGRPDFVPNDFTLMAKAIH